MNIIKSCVKWAVGQLGYSISRRAPEKLVDDALNPYSQLSRHSSKPVDLEVVTAIASTIPGMITPLSGRLMYVLCYFQDVLGDVVEVGSWQGRSASFLARATVESGNGSFFAIDHFKGNVGKEHYYVMGKEDLSDLKDGFISNMKTLGLDDHVTLLDMPNDTAARELEDRSIRFLFIDGDHTGEGVQKDIDLFFPLLADGALVVFDDYSSQFPGLIEAINNLLAQGVHSRVMTYANTLVLRYAKTPTA
jgi:predicted O-methyltransferase YrrM